MRSKLSDVLDEYDDVTADLSRSRTGTFDTNLQRWFEFLDGNQIVSPCVSELEKSVDFEAWYDAGKASVSGMVGSGKLRWPSGQDRLAMQLALLRSFNNGKGDYSDFDHTFFGTSSRFEDMLSNFNSQVFTPLSRDLRKYIQRRYGEMSVFDTETIPASDRTVQINHNSAEFREAEEAVNNLIHALKEANDFPDTADRDRRIAELEAGKLILEAPVSAVSALTSTLGSALRYLAKKLADTLVGKLAGLAFDKIAIVIKLYLLS